MFRLLRRMPFFRLLAIAQLALLARRRLMGLDPAERRRLRELVRRGPRMDRTERRELRELLGKLEPRALVVAAASAFFPLPRRWGRPRR